LGRKGRSPREWDRDTGQARAQWQSVGVAELPRAETECDPDCAKYRQGGLRAETREDQKSRQYASESISDDGEEIDEADSLSFLLSLPESKKGNEREACAHQ